MILSVSDLDPIPCIYMTLLVQFSFLIHTRLSCYPRFHDPSLWVFRKTIHLRSLVLPLVHSFFVRIHWPRVSGLMYQIRLEFS